MIAQTVRRLPTAESASDDPAEFEAAFRQVSRSAFLLARHLGRRPEESLDVVQEAALRAWRYRHTRRGDFRPWFLTIVYRLSRRRIPEWLPLPSSWDRPAPGAFTSELDPGLVQALRHVAPRQRAALWLRYCDDLAIDDVARIMGCSETAAKQLLLRGRDALRLRLQSQEDTK